MLKFIPTTLIFIFGCIAFFIFQSSNSLSYWLLFIWINAFLVIQFCGAYFIQLNFHLPSINNLSSSEKAVMLTFDDGPHPLYTEKVLDVLKTHDVKAIFCVIGKNINGNEAIMKRIVGEGHKLVNHSYSHAFWFDLWSSKKITHDILECQKLIKNYQSTSSYFRPPYGVTTPNIARALKKTNLQSIGWSIRSYDTSTKNVEQINERIINKLQPNTIILLHDRLEYCPDILNGIIPAIKALGYAFQTI